VDLKFWNDTSQAVEKTGGGEVEAGFLDAGAVDKRLEALPGATIGNHFFLVEGDCSAAFERVEKSYHGLGWLSMRNQPPLERFDAGRYSPLSCTYIRSLMNVRIFEEP
jgi:hypothetical protein